jgi:hypothetical protein
LKAPVNMSRRFMDLSLAHKTFVLGRRCRAKGSKAHSVSCTLILAEFCPRGGSGDFLAAPGRYEACPMDHICHRG